MIILSHRGFWREHVEKNGAAAFARTVAEGFGTETDLRDAGGRLVVSHDPARGGEMGVDALLDHFQGTGLSLAINVKADGLATQIAEAFAQTDIPWFAFDMSGPETVRYARLGLPYFTRHSDVEPQPILYDTAEGVWLDAFDREWFNASTIAAHLANGKKVCVVSSDLHGRDHQTLWTMLKPLKDQENLMLCTDLPDLAREAFQR